MCPGRVRWGGRRRRSSRGRWRWSGCAREWLAGGRPWTSKGRWSATGRRCNGIARRVACCSAVTCVSVSALSGRSGGGTRFRHSFVFLARVLCVNLLCAAYDALAFILMPAVCHRYIGGGSGSSVTTQLPGRPRLGAQRPLNAVGATASPPLRLPPGHHRRCYPGTAAAATTSPS